MFFIHYDVSLFFICVLILFLNCHFVCVWMPFLYVNVVLNLLS